MSIESAAEFVARFRGCPGDPDWIAALEERDAAIRAETVREVIWFIRARWIIGGDVTEEAVLRAIEAKREEGGGAV